MNKSKRSILKRTFIDPFAHLRRNLVFLGTFFGLFGYGLLVVVSTYDLANAGYSSLFAFLAGTFLLGGFLYWPLMYMGFSAKDSLAWRGFLTLSQVFCLALYISTEPTPLLAGILSGLVIAPFWCAHHIAMVQNTSKENRGYEVSIGFFVTTLAGVISSVTSAYFLEAKDAPIAIGISLTGLIGGTIMLLGACKIVRQKPMKDFLIECKKAWSNNPYMMRRVISQSLYDAPTLAIATLMNLMGISPSIMAAVMVARLVFMFALSPLIGKISHDHRKHGYAIGLCLIGMSWFVLAIAPEYALTFLVFYILIGTGIRLAAGSLMTGLYEMQSYASMMWSEVFLATGRLIGLLLLLPLMFYNATLYLLILAILAAIIFWLNKGWQKKYIHTELM